MDRDNLVHERLMACRADIGDRLIPLLDLLITGPLTAGDRQESLLRALESTVAQAVDFAGDLKGFVK